MRYTSIIVAALVACAPEKPDLGPVGGGAGPDDTSASQDTGRPAGTTPSGPDYACYAEVEGDYFLDGETDTRKVYAYDEELLPSGDHLIHYERDGDVDQPPDGRPEYAADQEWDADGNLVALERDADGDGAPDEVATYRYEAGHLVGSVLDLDGDGVTDQTWTYGVDESGLRVLTEGDTDGDGVIDYRLTGVIEGGALIREDEDVGADGLIDVVWSYRWDTAGRLVARTAVDAAGTLVHAEANSYAAETGATGTYTVDDDGDGAPDSVIERVADADGNLLHEAEDLDADGVFEEVSDRTYGEAGQLLTQVDQILQNGGVTTYEHVYAFDDDGRTATLDWVVRFPDGAEIPYLQVWDWRCP